MWQIIRDIVMEEVHRIWRRLLRRPEPPVISPRTGTDDPLD